MTKRFVITGAMGSGKSTVLKLLGEKNINTIDEPARQILAEQRRIGDEGVPDRNPKFFTQLLLSRAIYQYAQAEKLNQMVIYDRGIPDIIAYAKLFHFDYLPAEQAAELYPYETKVFIFPAWEDIYTTDDERIMSYEEAKKFGMEVQKIYKRYGYRLIDVPYVSPDLRAQFILDQIKNEI